MCHSHSEFLGATSAGPTLSQAAELHGEPWMNSGVPQGRLKYHVLAREAVHGHPWCPLHYARAFEASVG